MGCLHTLHEFCANKNSWVLYVAAPERKTLYTRNFITKRFRGVERGSSMSWVAKVKGENNSEFKLSKGWLRSYKVIKLLLSAGKWVVAKLQVDKSACQSSMELSYPWISGTLRVSWVFVAPKREERLVQCPCLLLATMTVHVKSQSRHHIPPIKNMICMSRYRMKTRTGRKEKWRSKADMETQNIPGDTTCPTCMLHTGLEKHDSQKSFGRFANGYL